MNWLESLNRITGRLAIGAEYVDILQWAYSEHLPDNVPHRHTYYEVCQVGRHGAGVFSHGAERYQISSGDLFIARPGVVHQIQSTREPQMELWWVSFSLPTRTGGSDEAALLRAFAESEQVVQLGDTRTGAAWDALRTAAGDSARPVGAALLRALMSAVILSLAQSGAGENAPFKYSGQAPQFDAGAQAARLAIRYIHDNLNRTLTVPEIASHVHLSPRHFARLFARFSGTSPALYLERARLDRARQLLGASTLSIKEVAHEVGYGDVQHFSRVFSKRCGLPPGEFRRLGAPRLPHLDQPNEQNIGSLV